MQQQTVLQAIIAFVFGHKYYVNIFNRRGTTMCEVSSFIFPTKDTAMRHRREMEGATALRYIETITFRSRNVYRLSRVNNIDCTILADE